MIDHALSTETDSHEIEAIQAQLKHRPIRFLQLDPNGFCNARCWYCPVAYLGNPKSYRRVMPLREIRHLLDQIQQLQDKRLLIDARFKTIFTAHYNEFLLYPHLEGFFKLIDRHFFQVAIFSNGTTLTSERLACLEANRSLIANLTLNIPASDPEDWSQATGFPPKKFDELCLNLDRLQASRLASRTLVSVNTFVPGRTRHLETASQGRRGASFHLRTLKRRFPAFRFEQNPLIDRAGLLADLGVMQDRNPDRPVVGCNGLGTLGGRIYGGMHIAATGDLFLCCNDFDMGTSFGNLADGPLETLWLSRRHAEVIHQSYGGICSKCIFAVQSRSCPLPAASHS